MTAPRILIDSLAFAVGGGQQWLGGLLAELAREPRGLDFTLLSSEKPAPGLPFESVRVRLPQWPRALGVALRIGYQELIAPLRFGGFDLYFSPVDFAPPIKRCALVVTGQNLNVFDRRFYDTPRLRAARLLARRSMRQAERVVFPSEAARDAIRQTLSLPAERLAVVPYGIDISAYGARREPTDPPYLFLPAAPERHKNIAVILRSIRHLSDPRIEIRIAGRSLIDHQHEAQLRKLARAEGVADRVRFLGLLPYEEVIDHYHHAHAVVFPSKLESFGFPLLEAMAAAVPLVASDIPVCREVAGDAARYFPPDDPEALARTVAQVSEDETGTLRRISSGRARAAEFTWERAADRLCELFREAISERKQRSPSQARFSDRRAAPRR